MRQLRLGLGVQPWEETPSAHVDTFATAARHADLVSIARVPPWEDFFPGAEVSEETHALMRLERDLVRQYGLSLLFAIDPTDSAVQRTRVAGLPGSGDTGAGFLREDVQEALVAYAIYVATNYEPEYLAVGVEINMLRARAPGQFVGFLKAYARVYDAVKSIRPETRVFPTFQLEDLLGKLTQEHPPQWDAIDAFGGRIDALAFSTYPYLSSSIRLVREIPEDYYRQLRERFSGEILISEAGYASATIEGTLVGRLRARAGGVPAASAQRRRGERVQRRGVGSGTRPGAEPPGRRGRAQRRRPALQRRGGQAGVGGLAGVGATAAARAGRGELAPGRLSARRGRRCRGCGWAGVRHRCRTFRPRRAPRRSGGGRQTRGG